jgi:hypothetical protein
MALEALEVYVDTFRQVYPYRVRCGILAAPRISAPGAAMMYPLDLTVRSYYAFREQKSGGKLLIASRCPHCDRDRTMSFVGEPEPNFKRLFDREHIR